MICVGDEVQQLSAAIQGIATPDLAKIIAVYEPVWAISTSPNARPATPEDALTARKEFQKVLPSTVTILYGGSVNPDNIESFLIQGKMDGALVGGASLDPQKFAAMIEKVAAIG